ncbi:MAG TPA: hypothetical protein PKK99_11810 [Bacteroidia bacterium]|nr:hypothetical protein [Bacteroidia bacterium]
MKTLITMIACFMLLIQSGNAEDAMKITDLKKEFNFEPAQPCTLVVTISGHFGVRRKGCKGIGFGCLHFDISFSEISVGDGNTEVGLEMQNANTLSISAYYPDKITDTMCEVEEDISIDPKICSQLGYSSIIIKKGLYKFSRDKSNVLTVDVTCSSKKN